MIRTLLAIAVVSTLSAPALAACSETLRSRVEALRAPAPQSDSIVAWSRFQLAQQESLRAIADEIFTEYRAGSAPVPAACLTEKELEDLDPLLSDVFVARSVRELESSKQAPLKVFASKIRKALDSNQLLLFKFVGHRPDALAAEALPAGFHRGQGSIFFDYAKIPADDWLLIFSHEIAHRFDTRLSTAIQTYASLDQVAALAKSSALTLEQAKLVDRVLLAGLDRGYLAEVRAWSFTAKIYELGLKDRLWPARPWMDEILTQRLEHESMDSFWLRYLDQRFPDPDAFPFNAPVIHARLDLIRADLRSSGQLPK